MGMFRARGYGKHRWVPTDIAKQVFVCVVDERHGTWLRAHHTLNLFSLHAVGFCNVSSQPCVAIYPPNRFPLNSGSTTNDVERGS